jgi:hypothetical protein
MIFKERNHGIVLRNPNGGLPAPPLSFFGTISRGPA